MEWGQVQSDNRPSRKKCPMKAAHAHFVSAVHSSCVERAQCGVAYQTCGTPPHTTAPATSSTDTHLQDDIIVCSRFTVQVKGSSKRILACVRVSVELGVRAVVRVRVAISSVQTLQHKHFARNFIQNGGKEAHLQRHTLSVSPASLLPDASSGMSSAIQGSGSVHGAKMRQGAAVVMTNTKHRAFKTGTFYGIIA
jgi:hypothetical protein